MLCFGAVGSAAYGEEPTLDHSTAQKHNLIVIPFQSVTFVSPDERALDLWLSWHKATGLYSGEHGFIRRLEILPSLPEFVLHLELVRIFPTELICVRKHRLCEIFAVVVRGVSKLLAGAREAGVMLVTSSRSPGGLRGCLGRVGRDQTRVSWDIGRCSSAECPAHQLSPGWRTSQWMHPSLGNSAV